MVGSRVGVVLGPFPARNRVTIIADKVRVHQLPGLKMLMVT